MCWRTYNKSLKRLLAEEDIPIFKVCKTSYRFPNTVESYFRDYHYQLGIIYKLSSITPNEVDCHFVIDEGFHSYSIGCKCKHDTFNNIWILNISLMRSIGAYSNAIKVNGYVPKGSEYYVNEDGECVSNSICLTKIKEL